MNTFTPPSLRNDIKVLPRVRQGQEDTFVIIDESTNTLFEIDHKTYFICQNLNGRCTNIELCDKFRQHYYEDLKPDILQSFIHQLETHNFLDTSTAAESPLKKMDKTFYYTYQLFNPNRLFAGLNFLFPRYLTPILYAFFCLNILLAAGILFKFRGNLFSEILLFQRIGFPAPILLIGFLITNFIGEMAKGITCRYFQGTIYGFNITFIYRFIPRFYCNITDTLPTISKANQLKIIGSGLIFQILFSAISVICWYNTEIWSHIHSFWLLNICASIIFIFFNLNPLLNRDGYQLISSWTEITDFRPRSIDYTISYLLGHHPPEALNRKNHKLFVYFGILSILFDIIFWTIFIGYIGYFLINHFNGIGACFLLFFILLRFENSIKKLILNIEKISVGRVIMNEKGKILFKRLSQFSLLIIFIIIMLLPYTYSVNGEFTLEPLKQYGIRAQVEGDLIEILVKEGQFVRKGDPVARLSGREQQRRLGESKAAKEEVKARLDLLISGAKSEQIAIAEQEIIAARKSLEHSEKQLKRQSQMFKANAVSEKDYDLAEKTRDMDKAALEVTIKNLDLVKSEAQNEEIRALEAKIKLFDVEIDFNKKELALTTLVCPSDGIIITVFVGQALGQHLLVGDLFAVVEDSSRLFGDIEISEKHINDIKIGSPVTLKMWADSKTKLESEVLEIAPVAFDKSQGRIIRSLTEKEWRLERKESLRREGKVIRVITELDNQEGRLKSGMTGYAKITCDTQPVFRVFSRWLMRFIQVEVWSWIP